VKVLKKAKESFAKKERYYDFGERNSLFEPELILDRIFDYLGVKSKEFEKFKELENEIVHFKKVTEFMAGFRTLRKSSASLPCCTLAYRLGAHNSG